MTMKTKTFTTFFLCLLPAMGWAQSFGEWQDPALNEVNREPMHTDYFAYESEEAALAGDKERSANYLSLDGPWKFLWVEDADRREWCRIVCTPGDDDPCSAFKRLDNGLDTHLRDDACGLFKPCCIQLGDLCIQWSHLASFHVFEDDIIRNIRPDDAGVDFRQGSCAEYLLDDGQRPHDMLSPSAAARRRNYQRNVAAQSRIYQTLQILPGRHSADYGGLRAEFVGSGIGGSRVDHYCIRPHGHAPFQRRCRESVTEDSAW